MIICPVHLLLSPCATCVRNCCAKPTIVRHQPLSQFVAANVWWTYQHHWTFPVWHLLLLPLIAPSCAEESLVV